MPSGWSLDRSLSRINPEPVHLTLNPTFHCWMMSAHEAWISGSLHKGGCQNRKCLGYRSGFQQFRIRVGESLTHGFECFGINIGARMSSNSLHKGSLSTYLSVTYTEKFISSHKPLDRGYLARTRVPSALGATAFWGCSKWCRFLPFRHGSNVFLKMA